PTAPLRDLPSFPTRRSSDLLGLGPDLTLAFWTLGPARRNRGAKDLPERLVEVPEGLFQAFLTLVREPVDVVSALQVRLDEAAARDRKSTRLNSSHLVISYAV